MYRKTISCSLVVFSLLASLFATGSAQAQYSEQRTVAYIVSAVRYLDRAETDISPKTLRSMAWHLRNLPYQGVDSEAVSLVWRTANWLNRGANYQEQVESAWGRSFEGGFRGGKAIGEGVENDDLLGVIVGIIILGGTMYDADQQRQALDAELAKIAKEAQVLEVKWQNYLNKLAWRTQGLGIVPAPR